MESNRVTENVIENGAASNGDHSCEVEDSITKSLAETCLDPASQSEDSQDRKCSLCASVDLPVSGAYCVCHKVAYCSKECQKQDWKTHKPDCPPYTIKNTSNMGLGVFATRKLKKGDVIMSEYPVLEYTRTDTDSLDVIEFAKALKRMNKEQEEKFFSLSESKTQVLQKFNSKEKIHRAIKIYDANSLQICEYSRLYNNKSCGVYPTISRFNHSCTPNCVWSWTKNDIRRKTVRALQTILPGEQMFSSFRDFQNFHCGSREFRRSFLQTYFGFSCQCPECLLPDHLVAERDQKRAKILQLWQEIERKQMTIDFKYAISLGEEILGLVRELGLHLVEHNVLLFLTLSSADGSAVGMKLDPENYRVEALKHCKLLGDCYMENYQDTMNSIIS